MPRSLPLAVDIADTVVAGRSDQDIDISEAAQRLAMAHPEAEVTQGETVEMLQEEIEGPTPSTGSVAIASA